MDLYYILVFNNTHEAMKAENICKSEKIKSVMMPTPSYITKSCGISLKVDEEEFEKIKLLIIDEKLVVKTIFKKDINSYSEISVK